MNKSKFLNHIVNKCSNCKYYKPNISYDTLGLCLVKKKIDGYYYINHYNYADNSRSTYGHCGKDGKFFELKEEPKTDIIFHKII